MVYLAWWLRTSLWTAAAAFLVRYDPNVVADAAADPLRDDPVGPIDSLWATVLGVYAWASDCPLLATRQELPEYSYSGDRHRDSRQACNRKYSLFLIGEPLTERQPASYKTS